MNTRITTAVATAATAIQKKGVRRTRCTIGRSGRVRPQRLKRDSGAVTEAERPLHERLSIFDRPQVEGDVPPDPEPSVRRWVEAADDPSAIRLGLEDAQTRIYLVSRNDGQISRLLRVPDGGSASTGPRAFDAYGAMLSMSQVSHEWLVYGVVPDHVRGVRVDGRDAVLANNTFLARVPRHPKQMVLTLTGGERTVAIPPPPRLPDSG